MHPFLKSVYHFAGQVAVAVCVIYVLYHFVMSDDYDSSRDSFREYALSVDNHTNTEAFIQQLVSLEAANVHSVAVYCQHILLPVCTTIENSFCSRIVEICGRYELNKEHLHGL